MQLRFAVDGLDIKIKSLNNQQEKLKFTSHVARMYNYRRIIVREWRDDSYCG
jgi:hypothetical protein